MRLEIKRMKSRINTYPGDVWIPPGGCCMHIALCTGLKERVWGDCLKAWGVSFLPFSAEKRVGVVRLGSKFQNRTNGARCGQGGVGLQFAERAVTDPSHRLATPSDPPVSSCIKRIM